MSLTSIQKPFAAHAKPLHRTGGKLRGFPQLFTTTGCSLFSRSAPRHACNVGHAPQISGIPPFTIPSEATEADRIVPTIQFRRARLHAANFLPRGALSHERRQPSKKTLTSHELPGNSLRLRNALHRRRHAFSEYEFHNCRQGRSTMKLSESDSSLSSLCRAIELRLAIVAELADLSCQSFSSSTSTLFGRPHSVALTVRLRRHISLASTGSSSIRDYSLLFLSMSSKPRSRMKLPMLPFIVIRSSSYTPLIAFR
jgi:hypothetical protein